MGNMHSIAHTKLRAAFLATLLVGTFPAVSAFAQDGAIGTWKTAEKDDGRFLHVTIAPCAAGSATLCGKISEAFGGADASNVGKPILWDMAPDGEAEWSGGEVWAPDDDKTYSGKMELKSPDLLELSGCVLGGLICRGQDWTRIE
ncbi:MAG: DUF2147 domain-containing protein [Pseudomonadota bacterium]